MQVGIAGAKMRTTVMNCLVTHRLTLACSLGFILACAGMVAAQSGRRSTKGPTTTTPSVSGPKVVEKPAPKPPSLQFLVAIEDRSPFYNNVPYYLSDTVLDTCVRRLSDAADVVAMAATQRMNRAEAGRAAKAEKDRFVVWLQLGSDVVDSGRQSGSGPDELYVNYMILEPVTAKIKRMGRTYHGIYKVGGVGVSGPRSSRTSPLYSEYAVKQSAREAAEKVLEAFDIKLRDER